MDKPDEPFCTIEWHGEGYQRVVIHDGAALTADQREDLCWRQFGRAVGDTRTVAAMREAVARIAAQNWLRAEWLEGGHTDPLRTTAAFTLWPAA